MSVTPFEVQVPDETLEDLKDRLARTRWPDEIPGAGWDYGSNLAYIKELVDYWRIGFDWRAQEAHLNSFPQFRTEVEGMGIHFYHVKGNGPSPVPIIITHGWPSSIFEILKLIPLLSDPGAHGGDPADAFDVIVPSMPGYGFSDQTKERGMNVARIAELWNKLMTENLGYQRYGAQGGDWGANVTVRLGYAFPDQLIGVHATSVGTAQPDLGPGSRPLSDAEKALLAARENWQRNEGGYAHIQGTKPQTLSYGLNDSPAGLAAWIVEKWRTWSDCGGDVESVYTKDELLTNVTIYWVTQTINSSVRLYYENTHNPWSYKPGTGVTVPCALAIFPKEISQPPREFAERHLNVQHWTEMPSGGHFAAIEKPQLLADDVKSFFRALR